MSADGTSATSDHLVAIPKLFQKRTSSLHRSDGLIRVSGKNERDLIVPEQG